MTEQTVLESTLKLLKEHGMTTIFGNPGSNEIPFLAGLTEEFDFVLLCRGVHYADIGVRTAGLQQKRQKCSA